MCRGQDLFHDVKDCLAGKVKVIFDVGANVGDVTKTFRIQFPSAHIYSFEPVESTYSDLVKNTKDVTGLECFNIGFSDHVGTHSIFLQPDSGWNSIENNRYGGRSSVNIVTDTLDGFCT